MARATWTIRPAQSAARPSRGALPRARRNQATEARRTSRSWVFITDAPVRERDAGTPDSPSRELHPITKNSVADDSGCPQRARECGRMEPAVTFRLHHFALRGLAQLRGMAFEIGVWSPHDGQRQLFANARPRP